MKIIGIRPTSFTGDDKQEVRGTNIYVTYPQEKGEGLGNERLFIKEDKLSEWLYKPHVGDEIKVEYNRYLFSPCRCCTP